MRPGVEAEDITVEVDQWFWSLYGPGKVILPQPRVVAEYAASVPGTFRFSVNRSAHRNRGDPAARP